MSLQNEIDKFDAIEDIRQALPYADNYMIIEFMNLLLEECENREIQITFK